MRFCASRAGRSNFGILHRCTLVRAGRNSVGLLVVNLYFYFFIGLQFRAGQSTMPCLHKALFVSSYISVTVHKFQSLTKYIYATWEDLRKSPRQLRSILNFGFVLTGFSTLSFVSSGLFLNLSVGHNIILAKTF